MKGVIFFIKIILIAALCVFYYPLNTIFLLLQKHYRAWWKDDKISYVLATPLYYLLFLIVSIISVPLETLGEKIHPGLKFFE